MYCPKCGKELEQIKGTWTCKHGEMALNKNLSEGLTNRYVLKISPDKPPNTKVNWGGSWFCPGCGNPCKEQNGLVTCPGCGQSLNEFLHQLIELHPHKDTHGKFS